MSNSTLKILVIEDEPKVASSIKKGLEENSFEVDVAFDGFIGKKMALSKDYDMIILDINIPMMNGYEVCKAVREEKPGVPIIMLTAFGSTEDKLVGFETGADDYLVKPFEFRELLARIKSLLKRSVNVSPTGNILRVADLEIDIQSKQVKRADKKINLTAKEFALLEYFMKNKGRVISKADIAEKIWDLNFDTGTNIIEVYVNFLRKKIDKDFSPKLIHTQIGMGYVLKAED